MNFYLAIVLRAIATLSAMFAVFSLGNFATTSHGFWIAPSIFGWVMAYGLWRSSHHVWLRHVESREIPF